MNNDPNESNNQAYRPQTTRLTPLKSADDLIQSQAAQSTPLQANKYSPESIYSTGEGNLRSQHISAVNSDNNSPNFFDHSGRGVAHPQNSAAHHQEFKYTKPVKDPLWAGILGFFIWPFSIVAIILGNKYFKQTGNNTAKTLGIVAFILGLVPFIFTFIWLVGIFILILGFSQDPYLESLDDYAPNTSQIIQADPSFKAIQGKTIACLIMSGVDAVDYISFTDDGKATVFLQVGENTISTDATYKIKSSDADSTKLELTFGCLAR